MLIMVVPTQFLPMPLRRSADATGHFVGPGEGVQMSGSKHIGMSVVECNASENEGLANIGRIDVRWIDASLAFC